MEKLFSEQYINFNLIHENHKSRIYRAISKKNNQSVIIKSMNLQYPSEKDIRLFSNGYHIINQLNKPNLIKVYDLKLGHKQAAFVMEDIGGVSLDKFLTSPYLTVDETVSKIFKILLIMSGYQQSTISLTNG
ncbi:MAG: hypothetical protein OMM_09447 [Candidatus Magnetoglobus multicellularis str. Araruama]|uniref:Serine-threonine/tyrosine-protein kinase catalytic domain-containing protein n=1 Tax=Candidatus Magnetoglobus multicellularis str. Araruama TaxID=890399 RepID=A0A1V1P484_9BACT|nr:MAG: hypothetical protein OMM_09447 [Candidatus Magnetoglobus multicellularis str. Araruama]